MLAVELLYRQKIREMTLAIGSPTLVRDLSTSRNGLMWPCVRLIESVALVRPVDIQDLDHTDFLVRFENVVERGVSTADM